jgi:hypothetical protein
MTGQNRIGGAVFGVFGLGWAVVYWFAARMRVRCDHSGIRVHTFRTTFLPAAEIDRVTVMPPRGMSMLPSVMLGVIRKDGSLFRLQPTVVTRMTQQALDARTRALTERMQAAVGL